jgi:hypothetical protein
MEPKNKPDVRDADDVIRGYYEDDTQAAFREDGTEPISSVRATKGADGARSSELSGGDVDAALDQADVGTETVGGSNPTPDQDIVEDIGRAAGVTYQDNEPLKFGEKVAERDAQRWELDPASSEDYQARTGDIERPTSSPTEPPPMPSGTVPPKPDSPGRAHGGKTGRRRSAR